ncbi:MAG: SDR family oxidoreductase [Candidatus Undinarchaeales archaeon]
MKLENKVAIITGSTTGIGRGIAELFVKEGAKVVVNSTKQEKCEKVASEIKGNGEAVGISADVSKEGQVKNLIEKTVEKFGKLDIMVNNAGILNFSPLTELEEESWDKIIDVNLKGVFLGVKHAAKQMIEQGNGGKIINTASIAGLIGYPTLAHYSSSKGGVIELTRTAALEFSDKNINVNAIAPGLIETSMTEGMMETPEQRKNLLKGIPMGRAGKPEDIAKPVLFLASDDSDYMTGQTIVVDGGWTVQ